MEEKSANEVIEGLKRRVEELERRVENDESSFFVSDFARVDSIKAKAPVIPERGMPARFVKTIIEDYHLLDSNEQLNTSTYVNVVFEPEEIAIATLGMRINIADQTVYPVTYHLHDLVVNMLADLWHCPQDASVFQETGNYAGAGTVGSTEACLLAGLALKLRWRHWYAKRNNLDTTQVRREYPNLVITSMFQACWEKFFKYMDIEPRLVQPKFGKMVIEAADVEALIDERTIGIVCVLGNHYSGHYDPVWEIDELVTRLNKEHGWQLGIHVDAASGGFIAPFQKNMTAWDFRLPNVLSISASGHKFGESVCGTGWVVWRDRKDLSEHIAISVTYLGGEADSYTLNFSRPASGVMVQLYKFLRLGTAGYTKKVHNQMENAKRIRKFLQELQVKGKHRFTILDDGDDLCLPVVAAMLNRDLHLPYNDIDLQHAISDDHWYVSGYCMQFTNPVTGEEQPLFSDMEGTQTMFRVVVKSNMTVEMAENLCNVIKRACIFLDEQKHTLRRRDIIKLNGLKRSRFLAAGTGKGHAPC